MQTCEDPGDFGGGGLPTEPRKGQCQQNRVLSKSRDHQGPGATMHQRLDLLGKCPVLGTHK